MMEALKQNHCHVDAFLPCETYTNNINENECKIPGYNLICNHRLDNKKGGGVATLLDEKFQFKLRKDLGIIDLDGFETCFVELNMKGMVIGKIYRVPNTPLKNFYSKYETILEKISLENETIVIGILITSI